MKRIMIWLNLLLAAVMCTANYLYLSPGRNVSKAFCCGCFAALGLVNAVYVLIKGGKKPFAAAMLCALLLAMAGDLRIGRDFVQGAALFAAAHIAYLTGYHLLVKPCRQDWLYGLLIFLPCAGYLLWSRRLVFIPAYLKGVCMAYALILSLMCGKAFSSFWRMPRLITGLILAGSVLFFFSDLMLLLDRFRGYGRLYSILCMSTYLPAQLLLAHSIYHAAEP